jgi:hypothetical protein
MVVAGLLFPAGTSARALAAPSRPAADASALPPGLNLGVGNLPWDLQWMRDSGVPWRYRNIFLEGGVNTGQGWETKGGGPQWALAYMQDSDSLGAIPVFSYYEICQSNGPGLESLCNYDPANVTRLIFNNLNNVATMTAYYSNFKLLLAQASLFGKPVILHIEVDTWGLMEMRVPGSPASSITTAVSSTATPELAGIPNTLQGFAWALLHLRDLYAPNAIMATHPSHFAGPNGTVTTSKDAAFDTVGNAGIIADFMNGAGISSNPFGSVWDLAFIDVDDHDAAWYDINRPPPPDETHWWDPTAATVPNGSRYLTWVGEMRRRTGIPYFLWQIPLGNQYYLTMNNTPGHYQDNRADWLINHAAEVGAAGVAGMLFSVGNGGTEGQTSNVDAMSDGVTNNNGVPTSGYQCDACNTHLSTVADDDGGFLRLLGQQFYAPPASCVAWPASGTAQGQVVSWAPGRIDVVQRNSGNSLRHEWFGGPPWGGPESPTGPSGGLAADPVSVSWGPNRLDVFVIGGDGNLYHRWWSGTAWLGWEPQGNPGSSLTGRLTAVAWSANRIDIIARTSSPSRLWHKWWDGSNWSGWEAHGSPTATIGDPTLVSWQPGRLDIFAVGSDSKLYHQWWPGGWFAWEGPTGPGSNISSAAPAVVAWGPNRLDILVTDLQTCSLWHRWWNGSAWSGWIQHRPPPGKAVASDAAAVSWAPGRLDVFVIGSGGRLWHQFLIGSWSDWEDQGKPAAGLTGRPAVVSWAPNRLDVFTRDGSGRAYHNWWDTGGPWGFWEDHGII